MNRALLRTFFTGLLCTSILASCASTDEEFKRLPPKNDWPEATARPTAGGVDLLGLSEFLQIGLNPGYPGFAERAFNTCEVGYGYSSTQNCGRKHLAQVQFRLLCRDSNETVSTMNHVLTPISRATVRYHLGGVKGTVQTNGAGDGIIRHVVNSPAKRQWLRLYVGERFLAVRAHEVREIVVPREWCDKL